MHPEPLHTARAVGGRSRRKLAIIPGVAMLLVALVMLVFSGMLATSPVCGEITLGHIRDGVDTCLDSSGATRTGALVLGGLSVALALATLPMTVIYALKARRTPSWIIPMLAALTLGGAAIGLLELDLL